MAHAAPSEQRKVAAALRDAGYGWAAIAYELHQLYGVVGVAAMRLSHGWTQAELADQWNRRWPSARPVTAATISGWERACAGRASRRAPSLKVLGRLAELGGCSAADVLIGTFDFTEGVDILRAGTVTSVDRRTFLGQLAAGVTGAGMLAAAGPPRIGRVGAADVERLRGEYWSIWHAGEDEGGAALYTATLGLLDHVQALRDRGSYGPSVGRDLQVLAGSLQEHAGFDSYDAGELDRARMHWHEALATARLADDSRLEVYTMAEMANASSRASAGRETVELTQAAQRLSRGWAPPRLTAVLASREAEGWALRGDAGQAQAALSRAEVELADAGDDGEVWWSYFTPEMLSVSASRTWLSLDAPVAAERAARESVGRHLARRPRAMNCAAHARTLVAAGELDRARHTLGEAEGLAEGLASARLAADLGAVHRELAARG